MTELERAQAKDLINSHAKMTKDLWKARAGIIHYGLLVFWKDGKRERYWTLAEIEKVVEELEETIEDSVEIVQTRDLPMIQHPLKEKDKITSIKSRDLKR